MPKKQESPLDAEAIRVIIGISLIFGLLSHSWTVALFVGFCAIGFVASHAMRS